MINLAPPRIRRAEHLDTTTSKALWPEFEAVLPKLLGGIYNVFCAAMKLYRNPQPLPGGNPRMMDFAIFGNVLEQVMGWDVGAFDAAYKGNRSEADSIALEDSPIWECLKASFLVGGTKWKGTATELKAKFLYDIDGIEQRKRIEKMSVNQMGGNLQRIMPMLNKVGWDIHRPPRTKSGRPWIITPPHE